MLDSLYHQAHLFRKQKFLNKAESLPIPVISVGNLTLGGTGKTPFVAHLAERLHTEGFTVGIASRGYPHKHTTPQIVTPDSNPNILGDEPVLLASTLGPKASIAVCLSRAEAGRLLIQKKGINVLILDDGFQHFSLKRELDIVLLDAKEPLGKNGKLLPLGTLREQPAALKRAGALVITNSRSIPFKDLSPLALRFQPWNPNAPILCGSTEVSGLLGDSGEFPISQLEGGKVFLISAIANPSRFEASVKMAGLTVAGHRSFRDHHGFTTRDLTQVVSTAKAQGVSQLLCTEKDWVKLQTLPKPDLPLYALRIRFAPLIEREEFWPLVLSKANAAK